MTYELIYILVALAVVSAISLIGVVILMMKHRTLEKALPLLVAFAAGALLGASFFDLIPESFEALGRTNAPLFIIVGILIFMIIENILHWHHAQHHDCKDCHPAPAGYAILLGDGLHNFLDGVLIASAFMLNISAGIAVTLAVVLHEIPQEIGDYAILIDSGFSKIKALWFNLLSAFFAVVGGMTAYFALQSINGLIPYLVAIGAGGFLYIALVDIVAGFKHEHGTNQNFGQMLALIIGLAVLWWLVTRYSIPHV